MTLTAKATLLENPITRSLLRAAGVVPLRRASDHAARTGGSPDPSRNIGAFTAVLDVLERGGVVLLFPEGKSHSDPELAPLKTGLARIALMARDERRLYPFPVIPIGLTFERKWEPRSRVLMHIGAPIEIVAAEPNVHDDVTQLTQRVDAGLRDVTLNFRTVEDARRVLSISTLLAEVLDEFRPLHAPDPPLAERVRVAQRINVIAPKLPVLEPSVAARIEGFLARFAAFESLTHQHTIPASDVQMSTHVGSAVWFGIRETLIAALAVPLAVWGRVNHWVPLRLARAVARRISRTPDEPATNTIVAGLVLVLAFYIAQTVVVAWQFGTIVAIIYAASLPISATWDFRYADRIRRAIARIRTYFRFRRDPELHRQLRTELEWLRGEALTLNDVVNSASSRPDTPTAPARTSP